MTCVAQTFDKYYALVVDVNKPLSNTEFVKQISMRGAKFIYRESIGEKFSAGAEIGFATYNDYLPPTVYTSGNKSIYTDLYTYVYNYTLAISGEYYFVTQSWIMPYAGLGLGVSYNRFTAYYNIFQDEDKAWGGLVRPHVGTLFKFGKRSAWGANLAIHLDYSTTKSEDWDYKNFSNVGLQAGLVYMMR
jgi:hypothetical protein